MKKRKFLFISFANFLISLFFLFEPLLHHILWKNENPRFPPTKFLRFFINIFHYEYSSLCQQKGFWKLLFGKCDKYRRRLFSRPADGPSFLLSFCDDRILRRLFFFCFLSQSRLSVYCVFFLFFFFFVFFNNTYQTWFPLLFS